MPVWGEHVPLVPGGDADNDAALGAGATVQQGDAVQGEEEEEGEEEEGGGAANRHWRRGWGRDALKFHVFSGEWMNEKNIFIYPPSHLFIKLFF